MEKSKNRIYLKPGQAARMTSAYEKQRIENIASNQRKLDALGLLHGSNLLALFEKVTQTSFARNNKRKVSERDDSDYRLDNCDDDFLSSSSNDEDNNVGSNRQIKKKRSEKNIVARSCLPWNHSCGSKSFAATISTKVEIPHFVDFFKESHWSKKKNDWLDHKCMEKHDELENLRTVCSQPDAIPMSEEEISVAVLGKKSGYLRGYGVGRKPSNTNTISRRNGEDVIVLREELSSIKELNETQQNQLVIQQQHETQNKQIKSQNQKLEKLQAVLLRCGLLSSEECGEDAPEGY